MVIGFVRHFTSTQLDFSGDEKDTELCPGKDTTRKDILLNFIGYNFTCFFVCKQNFYNNARLKLAKNQAKAEQHPEAELFPFENYSLCSST